MTDAANEPVFTGTPDQWWDKAEPLTELDAAVRRPGDWYISRPDPTSNLPENYRVSTSTLASNVSRRLALLDLIGRERVLPDEISTKVRRLIRAEIETPDWLSAEMVFADLEVGSGHRGLWRNGTSKWQLLADARIAVNERTMCQLNPRIAVITEQVARER